MALPGISVLSLGGTISSTEAGEGGKVAPTLTGEALVEDVPQIAGVAEVTAETFKQVGSPALTLDDLIELAAEIKVRIDNGAGGIVVTQGTDTMEEAAFVLDLMVDRDAPVVVTGAMRDPTLPSADGPANLLASVRVAASEAARGLGAVVVFNDEIHAARFVQKRHTQNPAAFCSPLAGPLGWISEGNVRIVTRPLGRHHVALPEEAQDRPVALYTVTVGDDGRLLESIESSGYEGLVVEALGPGHVPPAMAKPLEELATRMPVVVAPRNGGGETMRNTYAFRGSETDLLSRGLVSAGVLDGPKARVFLALLLRSGVPREEIAEAFDSWLPGG